MLTTLREHKFSSLWGGGLLKRSKSSKRRDRDIKQLLEKNIGGQTANPPTSSANSRPESEEPEEVLATGLNVPPPLTLYKGHWFESEAWAEQAKALEYGFDAFPNDIVLVTFIKCGTTWLKALAQCIVKVSHDIDLECDSELREKFVHLAVPTIDYTDGRNYTGWDDLKSRQQITTTSGQLEPRMYHTHLPYDLLPKSIIHENCRIVYLARNPKDVLISYWQFLKKLFASSDWCMAQPMTQALAFEHFMEGKMHTGPYMTHIMGYWERHMKDNSNVLFLFYEDLHKDYENTIRKLANFIGHDLTGEQVERVAAWCKFKSMSSLPINNVYLPSHGIHTGAFFRKGTVGDWRNHLTVAMSDAIDDLVGENAGNSLEFTYELNESHGRSSH